MSSSAGPTGSARRGPQQGDSQDLLPHDLRLLFLGANSKGQSSIEVDLEFRTMKDAFLEAGDYIQLTGGTASGDLEAFASILEIT